MDGTGVSTLRCYKMHMHHLTHNDVPYLQLILQQNLAATQPAICNAAAAGAKQM
jgi:hypothetical protein